MIAVGASAISYNADGHRSIDARYEYELDALNRVRRVLDRATNVVTELRYDALSHVAAGATDGQDFERWFAGSTRIHEVSGPGPGVARQHSPHPLWPLPFCVVDATGPAFIHQNEDWSTMCVTNATGAVLERHRYDIFGASAAFAADGVTPLASLRTEPMWRGMPALGTTALFSTPQRLYDPELGVFTSRDPLLYADSPSPYAYAAHNPVDFADPTGLDKSPLAKAEIGQFRGADGVIHRFDTYDQASAFAEADEKANDPGVWDGSHHRRSITSPASMEFAGARLLPEGAAALDEAVLLNRKAWGELTANSPSGAQIFEPGQNLAGVKELTFIEHGAARDVAAAVAGETGAETVVLSGVGKVGPNTLAELLAQSGWEGGHIRLVACSTGMCNVRTGLIYGEQLVQVGSELIGTAAPVVVRPRVGVGVGAFRYFTP